MADTGLQVANAARPALHGITGCGKMADYAARTRTPLGPRIHVDWLCQRLAEGESCRS